ncbi:MAG: hypothetical protein PWQ72_1989, partial [Pseudothermotoga sp.]|nr:hypothetical protein [Pseudothermotoga sp.]
MTVSDGILDEHQFKIFGNYEVQIIRKHWIKSVRTLSGDYD